MALINCPECGKEISDKANSCPNCGCPINKTDSRITVENSNYYQRPQAKEIETNREEKCSGTKILFWIILIVFCFCLKSCLSTGTDSEQEDTPDNYDSYDEYVEAQRIVSDETIIEEMESEIEVETETVSEIELEVGTDISKEEYIELCQEYNYKDVLRNPSDYVGQKIKITIEISSVHEASWLNDTKYYFGYSESDYGNYYGDKYAVFDCRQGDDLKLLSDDVITVYGEISEPEYTSSYILNSEELFCINMYYVDLIDE